MAGGSKSRSGERKGELLLVGQVKAAGTAWPSPQARDWKDSGPTQGNRKSPNLGTTVHQLAWPTPNSSLGDGKGGKGPKIGASATGIMPDGRKVQVDLKSAVVTDGQAAQESHRTNGKPRGSLNSRWVAQLMGYPSDWCDLPTEALSALSETQSSRKSRKSSAV
jgi:hypothetical protein